MKERIVVALVAHGTVENLDDLVPFVTEIRRGRPPSEALIEELRHRYERIGGSPLLRDTEALARALATRAGLEVRVAMRLWKPRLTEVVSDLSNDDRLVLVPLAPFSVEVYRSAAERELAKRPSSPRLSCVAPWGKNRHLIDGWARTIASQLALATDATIIVTAHSLPMQVIASGDSYASEFQSAADALELTLGRKVVRAYQSQGAMEGEWLGPSLNEILSQGDFPSGSVVVAPIGFLSEHVETLYDLDVEASAIAATRGLGFFRAPAVNSEPALVEALHELVSEALAATDARI